LQFCGGDSLTSSNKQFIKQQ